MINISNEDFNKLERIPGAGGFFNSIYKVDDKTAYKIYHSKVPNITWQKMNNPALTTIKLHYSILLKREKEIGNELTRTKSFYTKSYKRIEEYLKEKEKEKIFIFIDRNTNLDRFKDNSWICKNDVIYLCDQEDKDKKRILNNLKLFNIPLYDFV